MMTDLYEPYANLPEPYDSNETLAVRCCEARALAIPTPTIQLLSCHCRRYPRGFGCL